MQALAPSLGGEVWVPVDCSRPGVAASSCWVYDPEVWHDGFLRCVVLEGCALPVGLAGVTLRRDGTTVQLTAAATVLLPAQLMLAASLDARGNGLRTTGAGLYAVTWSQCTETKSRRPVLVVVDRIETARQTAKVSEVDLTISQPDLFDPCEVVRTEQELLPVFFAAGRRPDGVEVPEEPGPWLCARGASRWAEEEEKRSGQRRKRKWQARGATSRVLPDTARTREAARAWHDRRRPDVELPDGGDGGGGSTNEGEEGLFFLPLIGAAEVENSWVVVEVENVRELEQLGELPTREYNERLRACAHKVVTLSELGKVRELESGLTLSTPSSGIVACWCSRAVSTQVHSVALDGRKFWELCDLFGTLSIGHSRVEVPSTGVSVSLVLSLSHSTDTACGCLIFAQVPRCTRA
jgi:hypothetical protein